MADRAGRLEGKTALVTGGSRGIGLAIATACAREGAAVVLTSRKLPGLEVAREAILAQVPAADGRVHVHAAHAGEPDAIADVVAAAWEVAGPVDVLVNNAATNPYFGPMLGTDGRAFDKTFQVNVRGYFEYARQVARRLVDAGRPGSIVSVTSMLGLRAAPLQGVYGMTKAAVISMTQTLAVELGPSAIRVNAIAPGLVETKFAGVLINTPSILERYEQHTALRRHAQPEEIAGLAVFLASDEATYVTGQTIAADGGYTAM